MNLTEFLTARIEDDAAIARAFVEFRSRVDCFTPEATDFVERFDPARVLTECDTKRRIVALHQHLPQWPTKTISGDTEFGCDICSRVDDDPGWTHTGGWCETLRAVALPYRDHPDFDSAWA